MAKISRIGIDTSKSVFQLHGVDEAEQPVLRRKLRRREFLAFFERLEPTEIGIEACGQRRVRPHEQLPVAGADHLHQVVGHGERGQHAGLGIVRHRLAQPLEPELARIADHLQPARIGAGRQGRIGDQLDVGAVEARRRTAPR